MTTNGWTIVAGILAATIGGGLWAVKRSVLAGEPRDRMVTFLWTFAAAYALIFAAGYLYFGRTVLGIHWLVGAAIAGWAAHKKSAKGNRNIKDTE